jgi:hypothetical protein
VLVACDDSDHFLKKSSTKFTGTIAMCISFVNGKMMNIRRPLTIWSL